MKNNTFTDIDIAVTIMLTSAFWLFCLATYLFLSLIK
jgi:hypothetical protein